MKLIRLTQNKFTMVDDSDFEKLSTHKWHFKKCGYAARSSARNANGKQQTILIHREILGHVPEGLMIDHIDQNKLNNTRENLRLVTFSKNRQNVPSRKDNKTGIRGVQWRPSHQKFQVDMSVRGKKLYIGVYPTIEEAAQARIAAIWKYHDPISAANEERDILEFLKSRAS